jgi:CheY-like chemotaxis protein
MAENNFVILCVDDEPNVLKPIEIMLQRRGFRVVTASDGPAAIELFGKIKFDAVILDYSMPHMSGGEVARILREENKEVPIILHTGYKDLEDPLLPNVTCTLPKGSMSFLVTKLNDLLHIQQQPGVEGTVEEVATTDADSAQSVHVA